MWGRICLVWFSLEKKLRMENVHGIGENFLSKQTEFGGLKKTEFA